MIMITSNVKKPFADLVKFLEENKDKKISAVLPQVLEMVESKKIESTVRKDVNGKITHIFCYYHKEWEPIEYFGNKSSSHTGYNTMCKIGVNEWTRRETKFKKDRDALLSQIVSGELKPEQLQSKLEELEKAKLVIKTREESLKELKSKSEPKK
jgi:hypothetical protein